MQKSNLLTIGICTVLALLLLGGSSQDNTTPPAVSVAIYPSWSFEATDIHSRNATMVREFLIVRTWSGGKTEATLLNRKDFPAVGQWKIIK